MNRDFSEMKAISVKSRANFVKSEYISDARYSSKEVVRRISLASKLKGALVLVMT